MDTGKTCWARKVKVACPFSLFSPAVFFPPRYVALGGCFVIVFLGRIMGLSNTTVDKAHIEPRGWLAWHKCRGETGPLDIPLAKIGVLFGRRRKNIGVVAWLRADARDSGR